MSVPAEVLDAIRDSDSFVVATHSPVDGDALGSMLALRHALKAQGRNCVAVREEPLPDSYLFLKGADEILDLSTEDPPASDLLIGVDAGIERLGRAYSARAAGTRLLNIDHHVSNQRNADIAWVDPHAAATGEMVFRLLRALEWEIDPDIAECLWVAIVTDTGRFGFSCTTADTLAIGAELIRCGAVPDRVHQRIYNSMPLPILALQARAVERIRLHANGALATLIVDAGFGKDLGAKPEHVKDLVDVLNGIEGVQVSALIRGLAGGGTKVSLRSNDDRADVAALSARYGGGGHIRAAGLTLESPPESVEELLLPELEKLAVAASG